MLALFKLDDLIPFLCIGAIAISAIYHCNLFYFNRTKLLGVYSIYLVLCLLFLLQATITSNRVENPPIVPLLFCASTLWLSHLIYIYFLLFTLKKREKEYLVIKFIRKIWMVFILSTICHIFNFLGPLKYQDIVWYFALIFDSITPLSILILTYLLFKEKRDAFNLNIIIATLFLILFNLLDVVFSYDIIGAFEIPIDSLSFVGMGYFTQAIFFSLAFSFKVKMEAKENFLAKEKLTLQILKLETERKKAAEVLLKHEFNLREERHKTIIAQRKIIANELQDSLTESLMAVKYLVNDQHRKTQSAHETENLVEIEEEIDLIFNDAKNFNSFLTNQDLFYSNYVYDIDAYLNKTKLRFKSLNLIRINTEYNPELIESLLPINISECVYLCIKECLTNIIKHADATDVLISILFENSFCKLTVADNGKGIAPNLIQEGVGLNNLKLRVQDLNGEFSIANNSPGSLICIKLPLN